MHMDDPWQSNSPLANWRAEYKPDSPRTSIGGATMSDGILLVAADDVSPEKLRLIRALGAKLDVVKPAAIANPEAKENVARRRAAELGAGSVCCDQFDNLANMRAHERFDFAQVQQQMKKEKKKKIQ